MGQLPPPRYAGDDDATPSRPYAPAPEPTPAPPAPPTPPAPEVVEPVSAAPVAEPETPQPVPAPAPIPPPAPVDEQPTQTTEKKKRFHLPKKGAAKTPRDRGVSIADSRRSRRIRGNIALAGIGVLVAGAGVTVATNFLAEPPTTDEVASVVAGMVPPDGESIGYISTGRQFLEAFLTIPNNPEDVRNLNLRINALSEDGASWRTLTGEGVRARTLLGAPELITPYVSSNQAPDARTGIYRVFTQPAPDPETGETVEPREEYFAVTVAPAGAGRYVVIAPPAAITLPERETTEPTEGLTPLGSASTALLIEFLKLWMAAGPDAPNSTNTALFPYLAPDANRIATEGLNGAYTFDSLTGTAFRQNPTTGEATGYVDVAAFDPDGARVSLRYEMTVTQDAAGKLLVENISIP